MTVEDFEESREVHNEAELVSFLMRRYGTGVNSFWLFQDKFPAISMLVKGDEASLTYFPKEGHPGFRSVGHLKGLKSGESTTFFLDSIHQEQPMINDSILPFSAALQVAKEFLNANKLPTTIKWFEL